MAIENLVVGEKLDASGFFSHACYFRGVDADEIAKRVGYRPGRLSGGFALLFLLHWPRTADFSFRGYSQMSDGVAQGHLPIPPDDRHAENLLLAEGYDVLRLKHNVILNTFELTGWKRLAKIIPADDPFGQNDYPPGTGIPQWKANTPLSWKIAAIVGPGQRYLGNYI